MRYLATGNSYHSLVYSFRVPHNTIALLVMEVCQAIVDEFSQEVFTFPSTPEEWREVAQGFGRRWNFHHACGALDGKHIAIKAPPKSGTVFHNYKGFFSIILLGLVDHNYKFIWVDVGANGSTSDCAVFNTLGLLEALESGTVGFRPAEPLPKP